MPEKKTANQRFKDKLNLRISDHWKKDSLLLPLLSMILFLSFGYFVALKGMTYFYEELQTSFGVWWVSFIFYLPLDLLLNLGFIFCYKSKSKLIQKYKISDVPWPWDEDYGKWIKQLKKTMPVYVSPRFTQGAQWCNHHTY